jgi:DNA-binding transcriptional MerR regulator
LAGRFRARTLWNHNDVVRAGERPRRGIVNTRDTDRDVPLHTYTGTAAAKIVGITYRQIDYWARTDLVRPEYNDGLGSGTPRRYTYRNLLELRMVKTLLDAGIRLDTVREVFEYLREHLDVDITTAHLVIAGSSVILCDGDELVDVVRRGQGVLNLLPLAHVKDHVDARIVDLIGETPFVSRAV